MTALLEVEGLVKHFVAARSVLGRPTAYVKAVHGDMKSLLAAGVVVRTTDGAVEFPFDAVKVEFLLRAA